MVLFSDYIYTMTKRLVLGGRGFLKLMNVFKTQQAQQMDSLKIDKPAFHSNAIFTKTTPIT